MKIRVVMYHVSSSADLMLDDIGRNVKCALLTLWMNDPPDSVKHQRGTGAASGAGMMMMMGNIPGMGRS